MDNLNTISLILSYLNANIIPNAKNSITGLILNNLIASVLNLIGISIDTQIGEPTDLRGKVPSDLPVTMLISNTGIQFFKWDDQNTSADDGSTVIKPDSITGAGRYLLNSIKTVNDLSNPNTIDVPNTQAVANDLSKKFGFEQSATFGGISTQRNDVRLVYIVSDETQGNQPTLYLFNGQTKIVNIIVS